MSIQYFELKYAHLYLPRKDWNIVARKFYGKPQGGDSEWNQLVNNEKSLPKTTAFGKYAKKLIRRGRGPETTSCLGRKASGI